MILIHTAFAREGALFRRSLSLTPEIRNGGFRTYAGEGFRLVISGPGLLNTASALGACFQLEESYSGAVNFGIAGAPPSEPDWLHQLFFIRSARDLVSEDNAYVDLLWETGLPEADLFTSPGPVTAADAPDGLVDMEGFAFFRISQRYLAPHQTISIKLVSDLCDPSKVDPEDVDTAIRIREKELLALIRNWPGFTPRSVDPLREKAALLAEEWSRVWHLTRTQQPELVNSIHAALRRGISPEELERRLKPFGPVTHKRDRNRLFRDIIHACSK